MVVSGMIRNSTTAEPADSPRRKIISPKSLSKVRSIRPSRSQISATASSDKPAWSSATEDTSCPLFRSAESAGRGKFSSARNFTQSPGGKPVRCAVNLRHIEGKPVCPAQTNADNSQESERGSSRPPAGPRQIPRKFLCLQLSACRQELLDRLRFSLSVPRFIIHQICNTGVLTFFAHTLQSVT